MVSKVDGKLHLPFSMIDVIVSFMTNITAEMAAKLTDAIINILGNEGCEAISHVKELLYSRGWHNLGNSSDFERLVERLGFTIRTGYNDRNQERQEIAIETETETKARKEREAKLSKIYRDTFNASMASTKSPMAARDAAKKACVKARKTL